MSMAELYRKLTALARADLKGAATGADLRELIAKSLDLVLQSDLVELVSKVNGKEYVMASYRGRYSRPINKALFNANTPEKDIIKTIFNLEPLFDWNKLDVCLYTAAMSYPIANDLEKDGDKKSPGTFFEILIGHIVASRYNVNPIKQIKVPTLEHEVMIPTDFVYELGQNRRIHLPIKISTRERVVQIWAHQKLLDGMHGAGGSKVSSSASPKRISRRISPL